MKQKHRLTYNLLAATAKYVRSIPVENRERLARRLAGFVFHHHIPIRKDIALRNLRRAFPGHSANWHRTILKYCYLSYIRNLLQFFALPDSYRRAPITINGKELLDASLREGKGVLLISGHFGVPGKCWLPGWDTTDILLSESPNVRKIAVPTNFSVNYANTAAYATFSAKHRWIRCTLS
ncbi:MAG: hypothetical protein GXO92_03245 [FCB group bacterium]|nr:hypothetical protein [FCB group bacterium]